VVCVLSRSVTLNHPFQIEQKFLQKKRLVKKRIHAFSSCVDNDVARIVPESRHQNQRNRIDIHDRP